MARSYFTDERWKVMEAFLCSDKRQGLGGKNDRTFFEAVFYWHRTGVPWRDLPSEFGPWQTVYNRFNRWSKDGKWERLFAFLKTSPDNRRHAIDSTINKAHQHSAGQKKGAQIIPSASLVVANRQNVIWWLTPKDVR